jgi:hypothetical protein
LVQTFPSLQAAKPMLTPTNTTNNTIQMSALLRLPCFLPRHQATNATGPSKALRGSKRNGG